jgi:hypothetical protein
VTAGHTSAAGVKALRDIARAICRRDRVVAVVLAGTDFNLIFDEGSAGFPAFDCASAHINAILDRATPELADNRPRTRRWLGWGRGAHIAHEFESDATPHMRHRAGAVAAVIGPAPLHGAGVRWWIAERA